MISCFCVPRTGLEPARPERAPAPQAGVSTDFTTWADYNYPADHPAALTSYLFRYFPGPGICISQAEALHMSLKYS